MSDRGVWFRNSMANIELSADLRILTQSRQLTVSGMIQTVRGKVLLLQKEFEITHGTVEIRQGIPPEIHLDVHASTTVRGAMDGENYMIDITLTGDPVNPEMILSGTGPAGTLSQEDVLSLLAVGLTYGELQQMDSATLEAELESVAQVYVGQLLASHIRDGIGLDALNITPQLLSDSTALTVNVGKYVLRDLYVSYTGDVFSSQPGTISAQYYISRDFSVLGTTKSTLNGDQEPSIELHYTLRY
jgi:autotransporter translocation and assembly factor TamB